MAFAIWALVPVAVQAMSSDAKQLLLYDAASNMVLYERAAGERMHPSSMSKLMTLYVLFQRIKDGVYSLEDSFPVSEKAWRKGGSKMFVEVGKNARIEDLIRGIIVQSGNDACIVLAEGISGSEDAFAEEMNAAAKTLGLTGSHFTNATGWPDENHYMTARDLLRLSHHIVRDFPEFYHYFAERSFTYGGIRQPNRNLLLDGELGVDGLKTGHTEAAGYGIILSAYDEAQKRRIYLLLNGLDSEKQRKIEGQNLLRYGFKEFSLASLSRQQGVYGTVPVWLGSEDNVAVMVAPHTSISVPKSKRDQVKVAIRHARAVPAPIAEGDHIADLVITLPDVSTAQTVPLYAAGPVDEIGFFGHVFHATRALFGG